MFAFLISLLSSQLASAAPLPGMGSSILTSQNAGIYFHARGYKLSLNDTDWNLKKIVFTEQRDLIKIESTDHSEAKIEISKIEKPMSLKSFTQKWNKDYYNFGFEILGKKELNMNNNSTMLVDLYHRKENKNIRQVIISDDGNNIQEKVFVLSCKYISNDAASIKNCNDLVMKFGWLAPSITTK